MQFALQGQINIFLQKGNRKEIELVARPGGVCVPANGENDCVEDILEGCPVIILSADFDLPWTRFTFLLNQFQSGGYAWLHKVNSVFLHVSSNLLGHLLVKASKEDGTDHDSDVQAKTSQETAALK